ncbi:MauE/DoxX family redox-associated membrane protein [Micromonospora sp. NPDC049903]|uniref:MauE/DoxX family redox-associated membrane protein n=1 Tax=Micromonospora sp. NPDC049903 TaxID=3364276 RepID=UPI003790FFCF
MSPYELVLVIVNSVVAATLVQAGLSKVVTPGQLRQALTEVGVPPSAASYGAVRGYAGIECLAGVALLLAVTRPVGIVLVATTGLAITALGLLGLLRGSAQPCGCLGDPDGRPLGLPNVVIGVALVAAAVVNTALPTPADPISVLGAALALLVLCLYVNRSWTWPLIRLDRGPSL